MVPDARHSSVQSLVPVALPILEALSVGTWVPGGTFCRKKIGVAAGAGAGVGERVGAGVEV
jgi:hypothetical protein